MSGQLILGLKDIFFNALMYFIFIIGIVVGISLFTVAENWGVKAHFSAAMVFIATAAGGSLCHFFHHLVASYLAKHGDDIIRRYEDARANHIFNLWVVGILNFIIIGVMTYYFALSIGKVFALYQFQAVLQSIAYGIGIVLFFSAKKLATDGWGGHGGIPAL